MPTMLRTTMSTPVGLRLPVVPEGPRWRVALWDAGTHQTSTPAPDRYGRVAASCQRPCQGVAVGPT